MRFDDQFAEQRISPGKPFAGKVGRVVFVERFVHKTGACMRGFEPVQAFCYLGFAG